MVLDYWTRNNLSKLFTWSTSDVEKKNLEKHRQPRSTLARPRIPDYLLMITSIWFMLSVKIGLISGVQLNVQLLKVPKQFCTKKNKLLLIYLIDGREERVVAFRLRALENFHRKSQEKTAYIHPIPHPRVPRGKDLEILLYIYELINLMEYYIRQAVNGAIMVI